LPSTIAAPPLKLGSCRAVAGLAAGLSFAAAPLRAPMTSPLARSA